MSANLLLAAALDYAKRGWPVFPIWWAEAGRCTCGKTDCQHPGKHPIGKLAPNGRNSATTDLAIIRGWWGICPDANIGIPTGPESGLVVVDIDPRNGGSDSKKKLEVQGDFPYTPRTCTGGNGEHIFFNHPGNGQKIKSKPELGGFPGIDQKGDGGYIVAPPSNHISGGQYAWEIGPDTPLAEIPEWLMALLLTDDEPKSQSNGQTGDEIPPGQRNHTLTSLAGSMRRRGMSREAIVAALLAENARRYKPPLPESEVRRIAASISQYEPATGGDWPQPEPLRRTPDPPEPFPVKALGGVLAPAALAINEIIKAPWRYVASQ